MRKPGFFFMYITLVLVFLTIAFTHAFFKRKADMSRLQLESDMVKELTITDLCLFTEAGYTRHITQSDFHTSFQDSPMAPDHFPSGSLVIPPRQKKAAHAKVD
ncbi:MAG: hypothetical protein Q7U02_08930 [Desulfosalsimonadaceae bacterium]|nr:hypothetical protein [Desulfosalsimonadaceae bacterium]